MVLSSIVWIVLFALRVIRTFATRVLFIGLGWRIVLRIAMRLCGMMLGSIIPHGLHSVLVCYASGVASGCLPVFRWAIPGVMRATTVKA